MDNTVDRKAPAASKVPFNTRMRNEARARSTLIALAGVLILVMIFTGLQSDVFFTLKNFRNILAQVSVLTVVAIGTTLLMVAGLIDLSIGSMFSLVGVVAGLLMVAGYPLWLALLVPLLFAAALGAGNGVLAAWSPSHPFVVTLGMSILFQGVAIGLSDGKPISGLYEQFNTLSRTNLFVGLPVPVWMAMGVALIGAAILNFTVFGRHLYSIGGNEQAARLAGVRVRWTKVAVYSLNGLLVGLAALMLSSRISSAQPWMGQGYELQAIAAVAVGGTPLAGGRGGILGTLLGVLLLGVISNALNLLGISGAFQYILEGLVIVVAVMTQRRQ